MPNLVRVGPRGRDPIILIHPVGLDLTYWDPQIEALSQRHDVIAYDLPGHGRSPGEAADWSFDQAAELLAEVARSTGSARVGLVGLSVGGMIAQALAVAQPDLVSGLALMATAASFDEAARAALRARAERVRQGGMPAVLASTIERWFTSDTCLKRPQLIDRVEKTLLGNDPRVHAAMWDMIAGLDFVDRLPRVACKTLVIAAEHDLSTPAAAATALAHCIEGAEVRVIAHAAHMVALEQPAAVNAALESFF